MSNDLDDEVLKDLYNWIDHIPLSRPKKNIARDFSDGVMMAELMKHFFPHLVDMHNYPDCSAVGLKKKNWEMLNWRVFKKLQFELSEDIIDSLANSKPGTVERVLLLMRTKMDRSLYDYQRRHANGEGGSYQDHSPKGSPRGKKPPPIAGNTGGYGSHRKSEFHQHLLESDFVSQRDYDQKAQECMAKDETIEILQAKVRRLEHLIQLKDVRIEDLSRRLEDVKNSQYGISMTTGHVAKQPPLPRH